MASHSKRSLTNEVRETNVALDTTNNRSETPTDIFVQLQNVGSRVRKSVTEGYAFLPPSQNRSPAMRSVSMGTIFRSANDTLHEVFFTSPAPTTSSVSAKKRPREDPEHNESEDIHTDHEDPVDQLVRSPLRTEGSMVTRPVKPLRNKATCSVPNGFLRFSSETPQIKPNQTLLEENSEEDWSIPDSQGGTTFKPTAL